MSHFSGLVVLTVCNIHPTKFWNNTVNKFRVKVNLLVYFVVNFMIIIVILVIFMVISVN